MVKGKYFLNDWEALAELRDYSDYLAESNLGFEAAWNELCKALPEDYEDEDREELSRMGNTPFDVLYLHLSIGRYPPPELMQMLSLVLRNYFSLKGSHDLESLFFGKPIENRGTFAARRKREYLFVRFDSEYKSEKNLAAHNKKSAPTQVAIAEKFLFKYGECERDPVNFVRSWRRWKKSPTKYY